MSRRTKKARGQAAVAAKAALPPPPVKPSRAALLFSCAVFLLVVIVYLCTLESTVVSRKDNGEMISAAHVLGIIHPTGYPLWTMLARLFDLLPVGHTSAYRMALLSAVSLAAASAIICWLVVTLSESLLAGPFAGLIFAFWLPTWSQAVVAESYGPQALLIALFLLSLWLWEGKRSPRALMWVALAAGFASSNHRTGFLLVAPALPFAFWLTRFRSSRANADLAQGIGAPRHAISMLSLPAGSRGPPIRFATGGTPSPGTASGIMSSGASTMPTRFKTPCRRRCSRRSGCGRPAW